MKNFVLYFLVSFFIVFNMDVNAKVEQSLNEYKIEQLQKGIDELKKEIDELKKDVDDKKEKQIENKKDNESLKDRIGDINFNITAFAIFITILLLGFGFFGYRNAKADAKKEAENTTKDWLEKDGKEKLSEMIIILEQNAKNEISTAVQTAKDEIKQQSEAEDLFLQGRSYHLNKEYEKAKEYYIKAGEKGIYQGFNNLGRLYEEQEDYEKAEEYYLKAINCGFDGTLINLGNLYKKKGNSTKAEEYYLKAVEKGDKFALLNLRDLYNELKEYEKLEKLNKEYKI